MAVFGDLCILHQNDFRETELLISKAVKLGYETIAISHNFLLISNKKTKLKTSCPLPINWNESQSVKTLKSRNKNLKILSRLTVPLDERSQIQQLATDAVLAYDILAVRPTTDKLFQQCCGSLDVDIISLDMTSRLPFYIKVPQVRQATERGIHFEIAYSPAIRDKFQRRYLMSNAMELARTSKGRNIIMSSEAGHEMELRGPYDVANLGKLFGMNEEQCKATVSRNVRAVLYHAQARKSTEKSTIGGCLISSAVKTERSEAQKQSKKIVVDKKTHPRPETNDEEMVSKKKLKT